MRDSATPTEHHEHYRVARAWACVRGIWLVLRAWPAIFPLAFLLAAACLVLFGESDPARFLLVTGVTAISGSVAVVCSISRTHRALGNRRVPKGQNWPAVSALMIFISPIVFSGHHWHRLEPPATLRVLVASAMFQSLILLMALSTANWPALGRPAALAQEIDAYKARWRDVMDQRAERRAARARIRMSRYHPLDRFPRLADYARRRRNVAAGPIRRFARRLSDWPVALVIAIPSRPKETLLAVTLATLCVTAISFVRTVIGIETGRGRVLEWRALPVGLLVSPFVAVAWATSRMRDVFPRAAIRAARHPESPGTYRGGQIMAVLAIAGLAASNFATGGDPLAAACGVAAGLFVGSLVTYDWWWSYPIPD